MGANLKTLLLKATKFARCRQGAGAAEFALISPVIVFGMFSLVEFSTAMYVMSSVENAMTSVSRNAMINDAITVTELQTAMTNKIQSTVDPSKVALNVTFQTVGNVQYANLTAAYTHNFTMPFLSGQNIVLQSNRRVPQGLVVE